MDWRKLFTSFEGRIDVQQMWIGAAVLIAIPWATNFVLQATGLPALLLILPIVATLFPWLCLIGKRWHDRGKSSRWLLILLIPLVGQIWTLIECGLLQGTHGPNAHGADPRARPWDRREDTA